MNPKLKKVIPLVLAAIILIGGGVFAFSKIKGDDKQAEETPKKQRLQLPENTIPVEERPYLKISPHADGRNISLEILEVKKAANAVEYELEYQAGSLLQGAFGEFDLSSLPATEQILLGSCSAGGACTYHEDVQGGTLRTQYDGPEPYALKSRWKYIINSDREPAHSSQDAMFQIESPALANQSYLIIFNTAGFPEGLTGTPVSEFYSVTAANTLTGTADLTIRSQEEGELTIVGYDGSEWHEFETETDGKMASASVDLMELYLVIKK